MAKKGWRFARHLLARKEVDFAACAPEDGDSFAIVERRRTGSRNSEKQERNACAPESEFVWQS
jgi:hypothetical protein